MHYKFKMASIEQLEENVRKSFEDAKRDINSLHGTLLAIKREVELLKKVHAELSARVSKLSASNKKKPKSKKK